MAYCHLWTAVDALGCRQPLSPAVPFMYLRAGFLLDARSTNCHLIDNLRRRCIRPIVVISSVSLLQYVCLMFLLLLCTSSSSRTSFAWAPQAWQRCHDYSMRASGIPSVVPSCPHTPVPGVCQALLLVDSLYGSYLHAYEVETGEQLAFEGEKKTLHYPTLV